MLEIQNGTPFEVGLFPGLGKDRYDHAVVAIKGTFALTTGDGVLPLAEEQVPVLLADEHHGEAEGSSVRYEMDACLMKVGTDIVLNGSAYPGRPAAWVDVELQAGPAQKTVRVFGDRWWTQSISGWVPSEPVPFERMPLVYERAFGGADASADDPDRATFEPRNPVGTGFATSPEGLDGLPLPNLEDPWHQIVDWKDRPAPAGFGFVGRHWEPRASLGGTYDEAWLEHRCPFLPDDFDERFFSGASPGLSLEGYLSGGEPVRITSARPEGNVAFSVPRKSFQVKVWIKGQPTAHRPNLDTLIIEPEESRVIAVWRATVRCPRQFLYIDCVRVGEIT